MILGVYSIFDNAVGSFMPPMFCPNEAVALRNCEGAMQGSMLGMFPQQFSLYELGKFDSESGELINQAARVVMNLGALADRAMKVVEDGGKQVRDVSPTLNFEE